MLNGNNSFYQNMYTSIQNGEGKFLMDTNAPNLVTKDITENGEYNASADNADGYSSVTVNVAGGGGETFEVEFTTDPETEGIIANKTYTQALIAIQNNNIINFTVDTSLPYICGGCFIYSNPVTEKDDMYFIIIPTVQAYYDEEGIISAMEVVLWTETGITTRQYSYTPY